MIDVIWNDASRGNWDHGLLYSIFESEPEIFQQHNIKTQVVFDKAIIILTNKPDIDQTRKYLDKFKKALVILTGDEDSFFDWKAAIPEHHEKWTQYWRQNKEGCEKIMLGAPMRISNFETSPMEKKYLWSFIGQEQNPHRTKCMNVLKELPNGYLKIVDGFCGTLGGEVEYQEYLDIMRQSKFVICPSGSMNCDTFRVYEAIECGAIPITEKRCPRDPEDYNYWEGFPEGMIMVNNWDVLREHLELLRHVDTIVDNTWWTIYKQELKRKLVEYATD